MADYSIVKPIWKAHETPTSEWHWETKEAFHAPAQDYACRGAAPRRPDAAQWAR